MKKQPVCQKCGKQSIAANAGVFTSIPYNYCQVCKVEIDEFGYEVKQKTTIQDLEEALAEEFSLDLEEDEDSDSQIPIYPITF